MIAACASGIGWGRFHLPIRSPRYLVHLAAQPLDDRCPSDARSCKHGGRPLGVSHIKKAGCTLHPACVISRYDPALLIQEGSSDLQI